MSFIYIENSKNTKLGGKDNKVDATYLPISSTCPKSCSLKGDGCYALLGYIGIIVARLEKKFSGKSTLDLARAEARAIDNAYKGKEIPKDRDMRLHVAGDSRTLAGSKIINSAVGRWKKRGGGKCWSYTHSWKNIPKSIWTNVSMLASLDSIAEAKEARKQGYAPALVVPEHPSEKAYLLEGSDVKWIPCPSQTRGIGCSDCKLCFNADRLFEQNMGIAFAAHGSKKNNIKRRLNVIK